MSDEFRTARDLLAPDVEVIGAEPLLGNDAETIDRIKAPERFFAVLDCLGVPHPRTVMRLPAASSIVARESPL